MSSARFIVGDALDVLKTLPNSSVDLVFSSPPFLALRSYLPSDHALKAKEIGSEPTPGEFIDALLDVTEELARVLAPHGSLCFELGDTYSGSGGAGGDYGEDGLRDGQPKFRVSKPESSRPRRSENKHADRIAYETDGSGWPLAKSMALIPESYRWALAYGRNPFTGRHTDPWRVRNVVRWHRPNPPVGALGDKFRPATSDVVIACKSRTRYFDLDAVRTESDYDRPNLKGNGSRGPGLNVPGQRRNGSDHTVNPAGAPPLDTWVIPTAPYKGSHYATFPPALVVKPLLAMCPERVCIECGEPSRRIVGQAEYHQSPNAHGSGRAPDDVAARSWESGIAKGKNQSAELRDGGVVRVAPTLGWTDCGHNSWRAGVVLDPFAGRGTVLSVASGHGRDSIGIDLDERNAELARERVGMFLTVEYPAVVA